MGVTRTQVVKFIRKGDPGDKGEQGAALRGPQMWKDCAVGYAFQAGATAQQWKDVVIYNDNYYSCVKAHTKTASNYPGSTADVNNHYWQLSDKIEIVAANILLAHYALVENLGVRTVEAKDANGNIIFEAKDGNVTCVGDITAQKLNLAVSTNGHYSLSTGTPNGSICISASYITLPELPINVAQSLKVLNPLLTKTIPMDLILHPATSKVLISSTLSVLDAVSGNLTLSGRGSNGEFYAELIGINRSGYTYWLLSEMKSGLMEQNY